jgi:hypothetical protein
MDFLAKLSDALRSLGLLHSDIEKISNQIETATSEHKSNSDKEQPAPVVNAVLHRPQAEVDNENARAARHETRDANRLRLETWGVAVGAIVAFATIGQLFLTTKAVRIAATSANAAQKSAAASEGQVEVTKKSIQATVDAFRLDQRAWMGISNVALSVLKVGEPLRVDADIVNTGKTPAFSVRIDKTGIQTNYGPLDVDQFIASGKLSKPIQPPSTGVSGPNSSIKIPFHTDQPMTEVWIDQINSHALWIYVFGDIHYRDAFGVEHTTQFCGSYDPPTQRFDNCPKHNRAD